MPYYSPVLPCHAPRERVSWNVVTVCKLLFLRSHAPRERVSWNTLLWIRTFWDTQSRSTWACELKFNCSFVKPLAKCHAPRERVSWNFSNNICSFAPFRHAPRERVSWNVKSILATFSSTVTLHVSVWVEIENYCSACPRGMSRSTWACELKWQHKAHSWLIVKSRSTWACELKFCRWGM